MVLSHFFAVLVAVCFVGGALCRLLTSEDEFLIYGIIGTVLSLIATGLAAHGGI